MPSIAYGTQHVRLSLAHMATTRIPYGSHMAVGHGRERLPATESRHLHIPADDATATDRTGYDKLPLFIDETRSMTELFKASQPTPSQRNQTNLDPSSHQHR